MNSLTFTAEVKRGIIDISKKIDFDDGEVEIVIRKKKNTRTEKQNRALHLWFTMLAEALNDAGYDMKKTLRQDVDIPWTSTTIKENLWRPVQKAYFDVQSTTNLERKQIDKIFDVINKTVGERTGVYVPFPCEEEMNKIYVG